MEFLCILQLSLQMVFEETEKLEGYAVFKNIFPLATNRADHCWEKRYTVWCGAGMFTWHESLQSELDNLVDNINSYLYVNIFHYLFLFFHL